MTACWAGWTSFRERLFGVELLNSVEQSQGSFTADHHFGFEFRRYRAHSDVEAEDCRPRADRFSKFLHRPLEKVDCS